MVELRLTDVEVHRVVAALQSWPDVEDVLGAVVGQFE